MRVGRGLYKILPFQLILFAIDLLGEYETDSDVCSLYNLGIFVTSGLTFHSLQEIDLVHCRITSVPALRLERFTKLEVKCLG